MKSEAELHCEKIWREQVVWARCMVEELQAGLEHPATFRLSRHSDKIYITIYDGDRFVAIIESKMSGGIIVRSEQVTYDPHDWETVSTWKTRYIIEYVQKLWDRRLREIPS